MDIVQLDEGVSLNNLDKPGHYRAVDPIGAPSKGPYFILVWAGNVGGVSVAFQKAISLDDQKEYNRFRNRGKWTGWNGVGSIDITALEARVDKLVRTLKEMGKVDLDVLESDVNTALIETEELADRVAALESVVDRLSKALTVE